MAELPARPRFPMLDGLRVFAALAVFLKHSSFATGLQFRTGYAWMNHFEVAPAIFFGLSAFLLYLPYAQAHFAAREAPRAGRFLVHRAVRLVPAYWLALTVLVLIDRSRHPFDVGITIDGVRGLVETFTFTNIYDPSRFFNGIADAYTLSVEVSFYFFLVLWVVLVRRVARRAASALRVELLGVAALFAANVVWRVAMTSWFRPAGLVCGAKTSHWTCAATNWLPGFLDYFALGMLFAVLLAWKWHSATPTVFDRPAAHPGVLLACAAGLFWVYSARYGTTGISSLSGWSGEVRHELSGIIVALLMIPAVFGDGVGILASISATRAIRWCAMVSYGFYLWHPGWLDAAIRWTGGRAFHANFALVAPIAMTGAIATAAVSWYVLEAPLNRRRDQLVPSRRSSR